MMTSDQARAFFLLNGYIAVDLAFKSNLIYDEIGARQTENCGLSETRVSSKEKLELSYDVNLGGPEVLGSLGQFHHSGCRTEIRVSEFTKQLTLICY